MSIRKYKAEQIVTVLRQIEVQIANGKTARDRSERRYRKPAPSRRSSPDGHRLDVWRLFHPAVQLVDRSSKKLSGLGVGDRALRQRA